MMVGTCFACKRAFWWTGSEETVPDCSCGRRMDNLDWGRPKKEKATAADISEAVAEDSPAGP